MSTVLLNVNSLRHTATFVLYRNFCPLLRLFSLARLYGSPEGPGMFLIELLETYPHYLGDQENVGDLPFMFKVLSINKALSIQVSSAPQ